MYRQAQIEALLSNRHILIAGYGREGKSTHTLLQKVAPQAFAEVACNDEEIFACLKRAEEENHPYDLIIKSPGISTMKFEGRCNLDTITSQTDLFLQVFGDITVGITGTKGKSTTTTLTHHILSTALGERRHIILAGNMGIPLFDILDQIDKDAIVVAEFSCHQLENIHRAPHIGVILNLYQEHLDHYHDYLGYQMAKMQMMLRQHEGDHCFYCTDCQALSALVASLKLRCISALHPYSLRDALEAKIDQLPSTLKGSHNLSNIYVARQMTALLGVSDSQFAEALDTFQGLPHRLERVGTFRGITFYNDSISTIPESCIAAVEALQKVDTLILGGFDRRIDYSPLSAYLSDASKAGSRVRNIVFIGAAGKRMKCEWERLSSNPLNGRNILEESDYRNIVAWCYRNTVQGSICLLSPAAASYDAFKNFEERGRLYKEYILEYNKA